MDDILGSLFQALTNIAGGSEVAPLLAFCILLVLLGLGLGLGAMRILHGGNPPTTSAPEID